MNYLIFELRIIGLGGVSIVIRKSFTFTKFFIIYHTYRRDTRWGSTTCPAVFVMFCFTVMFCCCCYCDFLLCCSCCWVLLYYDVCCCANPKKKNSMKSHVLSRTIPWVEFYEPTNQMSVFLKFFNNLYT